MAELDALVYLAPPELSFWCWEDRGRLVAWTHGPTIAYREELERVMQRLAPRGLPPIEALLLTLAATRESWREDGECRASLERLASNLGVFHARAPGLGAMLSRSSAARFRDSIGDAAALMGALTGEVISGLDGVRALAMGPGEGAPERLELVCALLGDLSAEHRGELELAEDVLDALLSGFDGVALETRLRVAGRRLNPAKRMVAALDALVDCLAVAGDADRELGLEAKTGLDTIPDAAELEPPPPARDRAASLIAELEGEAEHAGLARIARDLAAVIQVPRRLESPDELPCGGFSDIANRGTPDRLLTSELAHDGLTLATRIALGEALYLRRESPPESPRRSRAILIDGGLKLWGLPRVYAAAAALAYAVNAEANTELRFFQARAGGAESIDLLDREEIVEHLAWLETTLHPGVALEDFVGVCEDEEIAEAILITGAGSFEDESFQQCLSRLVESDLLVATVTREGDLRTFTVGPRGVEPVQELRLDLARLTSERSARRLDQRIDEKVDPRLPLFDRLDEKPLRVWVSEKGHWAEARNGRIFGVSGDRRIVLCDERGLGAIELARSAGSGVVRKVGLHGELAFAVVEDTRTDSVRVTRVDLESLAVSVFHIEPSRRDARGIVVHGEVLFWVAWPEVEAFSLVDGRLLGARSFRETAPGGMIPEFRWLYDRLVYDDATESVGILALRRGAGARGEALEVGLVKSSGRPFGACDLESDFAFERHGMGLWVIRGGRVACELPDGETLELPAAAGRDPVKIVGVSADGHRLDVIPHGGLGESRRVWDLETNELRPRRAGDGLGRVVPRWHAPGSVFTRIQKIRGISIGPESSLRLWLGDETSLGLCFHGGQDPTFERFRAKHLARGEAPSRSRNTLRREFRELTIERGSGIRRRLATWPDGSRAIVDSRGLLHLQSSDPALPEIVLVICEGSTAIWSADGLLRGHRFFIGDSARVRGDAEATLEVFASALRDEEQPK